MKKNKIFSRIIFGIMLIIIVLIGTYYYHCSNQDPIAIISESITYSTIDGKFSDEVYPSKGDVDAMHRRLKMYKEQNGITADLKIYRTTPKDFSKVCKWPDYIFRKEWRYPFLPKNKKQ